MFIYRPIFMIKTSLFQKSLAKQVSLCELEDFVFNDFKIKIKLKDQTLSNPLKKFFELFSTIEKSEYEIIAPGDKKMTLNGQSDYLKNYKKSRLKTFNTCF